MARVTVMMNDGRVKTMEAHFARALIHCGKAVRVQDYEKKVIVSGDYDNKNLSSPIENKVVIDDTEENNQTAPKRRGRPKKIKDE